MKRAIATAAHDQMCLRRAGRDRAPALCAGAGNPAEAGLTPIGGEFAIRVAAFSQACARFIIGED
jgi:hypothetical protein